MFNRDQADRPTGRKTQSERHYRPLASMVFATAMSAPAAHAAATLMAAARAPAAEIAAHMAAVSAAVAITTPAAVTVPAIPAAPPAPAQAMAPGIAAPIVARSAPTIEIPTIITAAEEELHLLKGRRITHAITAKQELSRRRGRGGVGYG